MTKIVNSKWFQATVFAIITLNAIILGLETTSLNQTYGNLLDVLDNVCLYVFVVELIMRIIARRGAFFKSPWNWFDLIVVAVPLVASNLIAVSSLRVMRLLRQFKAMRLVSSVKTMQVIVNAIFKSIPSLGYTGLLMVVVLYIYAVIGVNLYGDLDAFNSLGTAMLTLIVTTTFEGWGDLLQALMQQHSYAWVYLISYIVVSALIMLNIVVGIVVNFVSESYESKRNESKQTTVDAELSAIYEHLNKIKSALNKDA